MKISIFSSKTNKILMIIRLVKDITLKWRASQANVILVIVIAIITSFIMSFTIF